MLLFINSKAQQKVNSSIEDVTVYLNGAQVTRGFSANLKNGKNLIVVEDLPSELEEKSIKVASASMGVKVLSINSEIDYLDKKESSEQVMEIQGKLKEQKKLLAKKNSLLQVYLEEETLLKQNKSIGGQQNGMTVEELKSLSAFFHERLSEIAVKKLELQEEMDNHREKIQDYQAQLNAWNNKKPEPKRNLSILVEASTTVSGKFKVDYTVKNAGWTPSYDVRVEKINQPISVTYIASVRQNTGEDWKDVKLTFSNADPSQSSTVPGLDTWWLGFNRPYQPRQYVKNDRLTGRINSPEGDALPGVNVLIKGTTVGTVTDINGFYELPLTNDAQSIVFSYIGYGTKDIPIRDRSEINIVMQPDVTQLNEVVVSGYAAKRQGRSKQVSITEEEVIEDIDLAATPVINQTTFEFQVKEPFTILSNSERERVDLVKYDINSAYTYYSVPKVVQNAYLTAKMIDWEKYNFLSGVASLFFEGKYIGKTLLDTRYSKDTLQLSLGQDKNVAVERKRIDDFTSKPFIGSNKKEVVGFTTIVKNNKAEPVDIIIEDQVPVSTSDEIEVEVLEKSGAEYIDSTGKILWRLALQPGESKDLILKYEVKYPKNKVVYLE